jgi:hypothetical protein
MAAIPRVIGVKNILRNLKKSELAILLKVPIGLKAAGLMLQAASQKAVPVDTGNLKASAFTRASGSGIQTTVTVGYTAGYGLFVHELVQMKLKGKPRPTKGRFWDPQGRGQAKFLEGPARILEPKMRALFMKIMRGNLV